jgi:hypothetical protein
MRTVIQLDEKRRGVFPEPFKPGDRLVVDGVGPESITLHLLKSADVPTAEPRWVKGRMFGAKVELNPAEIAAAVRADRDER